MGRFVVSTSEASREPAVLGHTRAAKKWFAITPEPVENVGVLPATADARLLGEMPALGK